MSDIPAALLSAIAAATPDVAAFVDQDGAVSWVNPAIVGCLPSSDGLTAEDLLAVFHPDDEQIVRAAWEQARMTVEGSVVRYVRFGCRHDGHGHREGRLRLTALDTSSAAGSLVVHLERNGGRNSLGRDALTGLHDRVGLLAHLQAAIAAGDGVGLVLVDLDDFHLVNEHVGFGGGDECLAASAARLRTAAPLGALIARVAGHAFGVVCPNADIQLDATVAAIVAQMKVPLTLSFGQLSVTCSVGVATADVATSALDALGHAQSAVRMARALGGDQVQVFDAALRASTRATLRRTAELRRAVDVGEIRPYYQPIVNLHTGATVACEALLRWQHPNDGLLDAGAFIDLAESRGIVAQMTEQLLLDACAAAAALSRRGPEHRRPYVSLNLLPGQLNDPRLINQILRAIDQAGIDPTQLMIEITERAAVIDVASAVGTLAALRDAGVRVALDDFGTGYSSLLRLRELPVTCLKVDRAFVSGVARSESDLAIVASVVHMAATLGLDCVAEGVESDEQVEQLERLGCEVAQGLLWSPAVPLDEVPLTPGRAQHTAPETDRASAGRRCSHKG